MSALDPITLGVVQSGLQQVCNEMDLAFVRSAFSPVISEGLDRSDGIYAKEDGKLIAQGELGLPVFVGTMQFSTEHLIATRPTVREGDIFAVNDPYLGGTHLMDVRFALPFFYKGAHFAWLSNTGHWPDTGGMVPGGFSARATEVVQEGLRFPPVKLYKEGTIDEEILSIILSNIRVPEQRIGDIEAQSAALLVGARRMTALLDKYGLALVEDVIREMRQRAARQMRAKIETIPDGSYRGLAQVDSDGVVNEPLTIDMRVRVEGTELYFDIVALQSALPGADEQRGGDHQVPPSTSRSATFSPTCRSTPACSSRCTSPSPKAPSSTPNTRARSRAARRK